MIRAALALASVALLAHAAAASPSRAQDATAAPAAKVELRRRPVVGEKVVHAFVLDHTLVAQRMWSRVGDVEHLSQDEIEFGGRTALRFADEIREVDGARATLLRRVVEDASVHLDMRLRPPGGVQRTVTIDGGSPLAGVGVLHRWIAARSEFGKIYDATEASEEFLPRLATTIDLSGLLPSSAVEVGARWPIDPARLSEVFAYGGLVPIRFAKGGDVMLGRTTSFGIGGPLYEVFGGETTGTVEAELAAVEGGVARIALRVEIRASKDQRALAQEKLLPSELYEEQVVESSRLEWAFRGTGELRWNVAAGRLESLKLSGAEDAALAARMTNSRGRSDSDIALSGGLKLSIDASVAAR